ncbi:hypothetical protein DV737_g4033, partial [Chaetothyriales sp. CBS 132003]
MATSTASSVASTVSPSASATSTGAGSSSGGSGPSSPLLFFVALGFGVVFTNLWIIVGVKYCFRYNQRNRLRMQAEGEDAVDLNAMPRQHRRRREKKLMSMDEVNEKFPLTKYKIWRATRAEEGLPTAGGIIATTASRPASISERRDSQAECKTEELHQTSSLSIMDEKLPSHAAPEAATAAAAEPSTPRPKTAQSSHNPSESVARLTTTDENNDDDDDDRIQTAVPAAQLPDPGDACAICIDTIEDDDDADYYVPKPRPEGHEAQDPRRPPQIPPGAFVVGGPGRRPTVVLPARVLHIVYPDRLDGVSDSGRPPRLSRAERRQLLRAERARSASAAAALDQAPNQQEPWRADEVDRTQSPQRQLRASLKLDERTLEADE